MVEIIQQSAEEPKEAKGLVNSRWLWRKLEEAATEEQMYAVLAEVKKSVGENAITVAFEMPSSVYIRVMGNCWFAKRFGELNELSMRAYLERAIQVEEYNLKNLHVKRNS
jgi:hypothetical protein